MSVMIRLGRPGLLALLLVALGCSDSPVTNNDNSGKSGSPGPAVDVKFEPVTLDQFPKALEQYKGKVVVLDIWSLT